VGRHVGSFWRTAPVVMGRWGEAGDVADSHSLELTKQGKIPHDVELEKHPEKSLEGRSWLMGDVSAMIHVGVSSFPPLVIWHHHDVFAKSTARKARGAQKDSSRRMAQGRMC
jgi:hypothetical protein